MHFWSLISLVTLLLAASTLAQEPSPDYATSEPLDPDFASFDQTMIDFMQRRHVPGGSIAVVKEGKLVYAQGYGYADKERHEPVRATSLFRIASISKPITALAILKLTQHKQHPLDLDAKAFPLLGLKPFLEGNAKPDPRMNQITIRQLLQHTAGFDRNLSGDPMFDAVHIAKVLGIPAPPSTMNTIRYMMGRPLDFDPGTRYAYSNFGYAILGRIIEKVTGQTYQTYVRESLLAPMKITRMRIGHSLLKERSQGEVKYYQDNLGKTQSVFPNGEREVSWCYGGFHLEAMDSHGGWLASAVDLVRFASQIGGTALEEIAKLPPPPISRKPDGTPEPVYYGLGWQVRPVGTEGRANFWHTGSLPGTFSLLVHRHDGLIWAVLFNQRSEGDLPPDGEIDSALHRAAAMVPRWEPKNLFDTYLRP